MPERIYGKRKPKLFISYRRGAKNMTQEALGSILGVSDVTISRWETGRREPSLGALAAISEALGCEVVDLFRHPGTPSADELLRDQAPEVQEQAIRVIRAMRR